MTLLPQLTLPAAGIIIALLLCHLTHLVQCIPTLCGATLHCHQRPHVFYSPQYSPPPPPPPPPPYDPFSMSSPFPDNSSPGTSGMYGSSSIFSLCFKSGNVRVCSSRRGNFTQADHLVVKHAEPNSPQTGLPMSKYGNAYYHPKQHCIRLKWGETFQPCDLVIEDSTRSLLSAFHEEMVFHCSCYMCD